MTRSMTHWGLKTPLTILKELAIKRALTDTFVIVFTASVAVCAYALTVSVTLLEYVLITVILKWYYTLDYVLKYRKFKV